MSVELLGEFVVGGSLLAGNEAGEAELFARFLRGGDPLSESALLEHLGASGVHLLGDDLSSFVHAEVLLQKSAFGAVSGTTPNSSHGTVNDSRFACGAATGNSFAGYSAGGSSSFGRPGHSCPAGCCPAGGSLDGSTSDGHFLSAFAMRR